MNTTIELRKNEIKNEVKNLFNQFGGLVENIVSVCPDWKFVNVQDSRNQIKVKLALTCDENRELTVVYNECKCGFHGNVEFATEIDAASSIDIDSTNSKAKYYIALAVFLSNKDLQDKLQSEMKNFLHNIEIKYNEYYKLDQED
jgi:hypothetical protein